MSSAAAESRYTPEQYLALERKALDKHEYRAGSIVATPREGRRHNLIIGNLLGEIGSQFRDRPSEVYACSVRVWVAPTGLYTYPDVVAVCAEPRCLDAEQDTLLNPTVIVEVLSPSTEAYDRGSKFAQYRRLDSLREYVLVAQDRLCVERFSRQGDGDEWLLIELSRPEDVLRLESIACDVPLGRIYAKVPFPDPDEAR